MYKFVCVPRQQQLKQNRSLFLSHVKAWEGSPGLPRHCRQESGFFCVAPPCSPHVAFMLWLQSTAPARNALSAFLPPSFKNTNYKLFTPHKAYQMKLNHVIPSYKEDRKSSLLWAVMGEINISGFVTEEVAEDWLSAQLVAPVTELTYTVCIYTQTFLRSGFSFSN